MASNKTGFDYFNMDTDRYQDGRIKRLKISMGPAGVSIYDYILSEIYRVKGCFLMWDESTAIDVADYWRLKETVVTEIVNYCCAVGLFSKELLTSGNVLTSQSIQQRFLDMTIRAKRSRIIIPEKYNILPEESRIIMEEWNKKQEECDRVKYSKVKKDNSGRAVDVPRFPYEPPGLKTAPAISPPLQEVEYHFTQAGGSISEAKRFFNHYESTGWMKGLTPITNWRPLANTWIANGPLLKMEQPQQKSVTLTSAEDLLAKRRKTNG